jgi:formylglycine-generating enzyme required for sulfatase activity
LALKTLHISLCSRQHLALPPEIGQLSALETLDVHGSRLCGLPPEIGQLSGLRCLNVSSNLLGALPPEIGKLSKLEILNISGNRLRVLPPEIGKLSSLKALHMSSYTVGALPPEIGQLASLEMLDVSRNGLTVLPPEIGRLSALKHLRLGDNHIQELPDAIRHCRSLVTLDLRRNPLRELPPGLGELTNLNTIYVAGCVQLGVPSAIAESKKDSNEVSNAKEVLDYYFAARDKAQVCGEDFTIPGTGIEMAWIPPGSFEMGDLSGNGKASQQPTHPVEIEYGFWMAKYPVTQGEYESLVSDNPSFFLHAGQRAPVERVSWHDCKGFCAELSEKFASVLPRGYEFRLPSEAEWEYGCRAGTKTEYYTGSEESDLACAGWYRKNSDGATHPVGEKEPNAFGLYDMHGNVKEWCEDVWHYGYEDLEDGCYERWWNIYIEGYDLAPCNGSPWALKGWQEGRVLRGGAWDNKAYDCRSAGRGRTSLDCKVPTVGFRVVMSLRLDVFPTVED